MLRSARNFDNLQQQLWYVCQLGLISESGICKLEHCFLHPFAHTLLCTPSAFVFCLSICVVFRFHCSWVTHRQQEPGDCTHHLRCSLYQENRADAGSLLHHTTSTGSTELYHLDPLPCFAHNAISCLRSQPIVVPWSNTSLLINDFIIVLHDFPLINYSSLEHQTLKTWVFLITREANLLGITI